MQYKNVVSMSYLIPPDKLPESIYAFLKDITDAELAVTTLPFSVMLPQENGEIYIKYHVSVEENNPKIPDGMRFDSYFGIDDMASITVCDDIVQNSEEEISELYDYLASADLTAITPAYSVPRDDDGFKYVSYKVGYCPNVIFENREENEGN
jgi:hypothetical protein